MFEAAELGRKVSSAEYKSRVPALREELLGVQDRLRDARQPSVIILFGGVDGAGKSESVNLLNEWMNPRWLQTRAYGQPSDEERERPEYWRFWRDLPPKGRIGFFLSAWYSRPLVDRVHRRLSRAEFGARLDEIVDFERGLTDDGALILKFWMHLGKQSQKDRLKKLQKDVLTRWRVTREQWDNWKLYGRFIDAAEEMITRTSLANAPWTIVEGADERYRSLTVATNIRDAIHKRLGEGTGNSVAASPSAAQAKSRKAPALPKTRRSNILSQPTILSKLDMSQRADQTKYRTKLEQLQGQLNTLHRKAQRRGVSTILVFEGWDAAGKGGAIRRLTAAIDARACKSFPLPHRRRRSARNTTCGASGAISPAGAVSRSSTEAGMDACSSNGSKVSRYHRSGRARTPRSTSSRPSSSLMESSSSSTGFTSRRANSSSVSARASMRCTNAGS